MLECGDVACLLSLRVCFALWQLFWNAWELCTRQASSIQLTLVRLDPDAARSESCA